MDLTAHVAAFMLLRQEQWYYFASTGWLDKDWSYAPLYDAVAACGRPVGEPRDVTANSSVVTRYTRAYERCNVSVSCTLDVKDGCNATIDGLAAASSLNTETS